MLLYLMGSRPTLLAVYILWVAGQPCWPSWNHSHPTELGSHASGSWAPMLVGSRPTLLAVSGLEPPNRVGLLPFSNKEVK
jgi:hypothetical protein